MPQLETFEISQLNVLDPVSLSHTLWNATQAQECLPFMREHTRKFNASLPATYIPHLSCYGY